MEWKKVFEWTSGKEAFNALVTGPSNFLRLQTFRRNYLTIWSPISKYDFLNDVVSEKVKSSQKSLVFRRKIQNRVHV